MPIALSYDPEADAIFVRFRELPPGSVRGAKPLDDVRLIHYGHDGDVVGVELLCVSEGVDLEGLPRADEIRNAMTTIGAAIPAA